MSALKAGPDLDRAVAKALGQCVGGFRSGCARGVYRCRLCGASGQFGTAEWHKANKAHEIPDYSTSWAAAGELIEALIGRGFAPGVHAHNAPCDQPASYSASIGRTTCGSTYGVPPFATHTDLCEVPGYALGATGPEALCRAALQALGGAK